MGEIMEIVVSLLAERPYLNWPQGVLSWAWWLLLLGTIAYLGYRWRAFQKEWNARGMGLFLFLAILVPITSLFLGIRLPVGNALPLPTVIEQPTGPALMIFSAIPWILAGGLLGPGPAALLAALSGTIIGVWDTHSAFTPLEYALIATLFSAAVCQRYRTRFYRALRYPLVAVGVILLMYPLIYVLNTIAIANGPFTIRLDFAVTRVSMASLALGGQLFVAGIVGQLVALGWAQEWGLKTELVPSPAEKSLETRVQYIFGGLIFILAITLMVGDWIVAERAARQMVEERLKNIAETGADGIPFFLETGQNLIQQIAADSRLFETSGDELESVLAVQLRSEPYFRQLYVFDENGEGVTGHPVRDLDSLLLSAEERSAIELALQGVAFQYYAVPPVGGEPTAQVSFIAAIQGPDGDNKGILIGRTDLASNPFTQPLIKNLDSLTEVGGQGILLDEESRILVHPVPELVMTSYTGELAEGAQFYDDTAADGTRNLIFHQPILGRDWAVLLTVSAFQAQQLALNIALPLLGLLVILSLVVFILMRFGVNMITGSLRSLAVEAKRIAEGDLDQPLEVQGVDEVGQLRGAFEEMRVRLKDRLDELNRLLTVSQAVASHLDIEAATKPILDSALTSGATASYLILADEAMPDAGEAFPQEFASGGALDKFNHLNPKILALIRDQEQVILTNPARARSLQLDPTKAVPGALMAVPLRDESTFFGSLWVAYEGPHQFSDEEIRFLVTLSGQAVVAITNARLYQGAEIGRQQLAAILTSTPNPVLVTDHQNRILVSNPAAEQVLSNENQLVAGMPVEREINQREVIELLHSDDEGEASVEFSTREGRYFYATASSVIADGKRVGRVCVLQDITQFKELDELKSEFVASVSHDLRSPLTLMRGYSTMLQMVGDLNDQQDSYVRKILMSVDTMTRLVSNLLDLGRIDAGIGLQLERVPIVEVIDQVAKELQLQAAQKRIKIQIDVPVHAVKVIEADRALLNQALYNLVENAIKYTEPGGKVLVRLSERHGNLLLEVEDTGIGVAPVDKARLFERFYRGARKEARQQRGSGLGLAIVKSIAERHGGKVWVESTLGKGSQFFLEIPVNQPPPNPQKTPHRDLI